MLAAEAASKIEDFITATELLEIALLSTRQEMMEQRDRRQHEIEEQEGLRSSNQCECCLCFCTEDLSHGIMCNARHFACDECFSAALQRPEAITFQGLIQCPNVGCPCIVSEQQAARHASDEAWGQARRTMDNVKEREMGVALEQHKQRFEAALLAKSEQEREVMAARKHIESMMVVQCPRCSTPFDRFEGCAALVCSAAVEGGECRAGFCALCLLDCGQDAHEHVRQCPLRGDGVMRDPYFLVDPAMHTWERVMNQQRVVKLQEYWQSLNETTKRGLSADVYCAKTCTELGLDHLLDNEVLPAAGVADRPQDMMVPFLALAAAMGVDEQAMVGAFNAADGDLVLAAQLLDALA